MAIRVPAWFTYTVTGLCGVAVGAWGAASAFSDVRRDAADARRDVAEHEPRIKALEVGAARTETHLWWIREALRTGRDPQTNEPLPR